MSHNLRGFNAFMDPNELFNFTFNINDPNNTFSNNFFSTNNLFNFTFNNLNMPYSKNYSKQSSVVSNGKKIETITEIHNNVKSETKYKLI